MATATIGSDLEQAFRLMTLDLAMKLSLDDCKKVAYVGGCYGSAETEKDSLRFHVFHTLESRGQIGPLKLKFLKEILVGIGRNDLLDIIVKYKKNPVYRESKKKLKKKNKQRKSKQSKTTTCSAIHQYAEMYALFLTQFSKMTLSMRSALDSNDIEKMEAVFSRVANDAGDAVGHALRSKCPTVGIGMIVGDRSSSGGSSGICPVATFTFQLNLILSSNQAYFELIIVYDHSM